MKPTAIVIDSTRNRVYLGARFVTMRLPMFQFFEQVWSGRGAFVSTDTIYRNLYALRPGCDRPIYKHIGRRAFDARKRLVSIGVTIIGQQNLHDGGYAVRVLPGGKQ